MNMKKCSHFIQNLIGGAMTRVFAALAVKLLDSRQLGIFKKLSLFTSRE